MSVAVSSCGNAMSVYGAVANLIHHGSCIMHSTPFVLKPQKQALDLGSTSK